VNWSIIRHADKEQGDFYNPLLRHQDQPISAKGRSEARNLCTYFTEKSIATIHVSEYVRTRQTIDYVAQNLKLLPTIDHRLNEIDNGVIEGLAAIFKRSLRAMFVEVSYLFRLNFWREMPYLRWKFE